MNYNLLNFRLFLLLIGFAWNFHSQNTNSANITSSAFATIVAPIGFDHSGNDLEFGSIIKGVGSVTLTTNKNRIFSNTSLETDNHGILPTAAQFSITGEGIYTYAISFTNEIEVLTNGESNLKVSNFVVETGDGVGFTGTLTDGKDEIRVGATLTLTDNETLGTYSGSFSITVAYN